MSRTTRPRRRHGPPPTPVRPHRAGQGRQYLTCGILAFGFARVRCGDCRQERLVAFSCEGRGVCPSCINRRIAEVSAHLCDRVIPQVPVRQWVLSVPKRLRPHLAGDADLAGAVLRILLRVIEGALRESAREAPSDEARLGAVSFLHRFGSALNPHPTSTWPSPTVWSRRRTSRL